MTESDNANELVIRLCGVATYGLLKILEDQFPLQILLDVAPDNLVDLELGYFNTEMGVSSWRKITDDERAAILDGNVARNVV